MYSTPEYVRHDLHIQAGSAGAEGFVSYVRLYLLTGLCHLKDEKWAFNDSSGENGSLQQEGVGFREEQNKHTICK